MFVTVINRPIQCQFPQAMIVIRCANNIAQRLNTLCVPTGQIINPYVTLHRSTSLYIALHRSTSLYMAIYIALHRFTSLLHRPASLLQHCVIVLYHVLCVLMPNEHMSDRPNEHMSDSI